MKYQEAAWREAMRIRFDFHHMMAEALGEDQGLKEGEIEAQADRFAQAHEALQEKRRKGDLAWMELPYQVEEVEEVLAYAERMRGRFEEVLVLGIGGSALGASALKEALVHPFYNLLPRERRGGPRLFILDNVDPDWVAGVIDLIEVKGTLVNVVSKSGTTAETAAQFLIFREALQKKLGRRYVEHLVVTTGAKGPLRAIAEEEGYRIFPVPEGVGGRYSVLSPVGLLPAALLGIDIRELLAGAAYADQLCREPEVWRNPAYMNAALQYLSYGRGKRIAVMMPYAQALQGVADWFRQLWAESLGKKYAFDGRAIYSGPTPVRSLGVTDQHSQLQLYLEGPFDKVVVFLFVDRYPREVAIPEAFPDLEEVGYLGGRPLNELIRAEGEATAVALAQAGRANCAFSLPEVNPFTIGQLLYLLQVQTAFSGELYGVNAFDQPAVEAVKVATYALFGRRGYEGQRVELEARRIRQNPRYLI